MRNKNYIVATSTLKEDQRRVSIRHEGEKGQLTLVLPRYSLVGPKNELSISAGHSPTVSIVSSENPNDLIPVLPIFSESGKVTLGSFQILYDLHEPHRADDFVSLHYLEQFHYKTFEAPTIDDIDSKKRVPESGGRKAILICYLRLGNTKVPAGYVELQMPLLMVKPRHEMFANPFKHPTRPVSWDCWDQDAMRQNVNLIARIARVVVAPEFRGLGLARTLIESAKSYSRTRWHISGRRPLFLEISAEMLNHIDFVSSAGFVLIGKTEGNLQRIVSDLIQMRKGQKISSGIMTLQQKYLRAIEKYCKESGNDFDNVLQRLEEVLNTNNPAASLTPTEWLSFRNVIRFPLPYYLCGLDDTAEEYLATYVTHRSSRDKPKNRFRTCNASIKLSGLRINTNFKIPHTPYTRLIMDAFGIKGDLLQQLVCGPIDIEASAGNLIFVAGASGSGKSVLLRALDPIGVTESESLILSFKGKQNYSVAWLKPINSDKPIFDYFSERYSPEATFAALSNVGLSEAFVFLKPFSLLSRGQKYRAMLADLLLRDDQVWLIDEFCSDLDPLSAKILSHNLRRHVLRTGRICFVAAANHSHYIDVLRPTSVIVLSAGANPKFVTYKDYRNEFLYKAS